MNLSLFSAYRLLCANMLLQSGLTFGASDQLNGGQRIGGGNDHKMITQPSVEPYTKTMVDLNGTPVPAANTAAMQQQPTHMAAANEVAQYVEMVQDSLKDGWSVHATKDGRLYYCK